MLAREYGVFLTVSVFMFAANPALGDDAAPAAEEPGSSTPQREPSPQPTSNQGFYLRTGLGGGFVWAHAGETDEQPSLALQALSGSISLHPGYQFLPGFALHADIYTSLAFAYKAQTSEESDEYSAKKTGLATATLGVGVSYHALPGDLFVSAGAGLSEAFASKWSAVDEGSGSLILTDSGITAPGFATHGSVGKLFSVHRRWSLGAAVNYQYQTFGRIDETDLSFQRVHALWFGFATSFHPAYF